MTMNKKVLVISSSPRKGGNSETLCDQFASGARERGHVVEKILLSERTIGYCSACGHCQSNMGSCSKKDDVAGVLEKMIDSDVIVMATPVYYYTMSGQMKTLIDRTVARYRELSNKEFYFIVTAAVDSVSAMERTIEGFRGFTDCLSEPKEKGVIYGIGAWGKGDIEDRPAMQQAYEMGQNV